MGSKRDHRQGSVDAYSEPRIDPLRFRRVLSHFPTGVVVVTAIDEDGVPCGMTVGSFASASLDPPLIVFLPARTSTSWPRIERAGAFCVNVLGAYQDSISRSFAVSGGDKFAGVEWVAAPCSGAPVIVGSVAWLDCGLDRVDDAGDHLLVLGRVNALEAAEDNAPLVFFQSGYGTFNAQSAPRHHESGRREGDCLRSDRRYGVMTSAPAGHRAMSDEPRASGEVGQSWS